MFTPGQYPRRHGRPVGCAAHAPAAVAPVAGAEPRRRGRVGSQRLGVNPAALRRDAPVAPFQGWYVRVGGCGRWGCGATGAAATPAGPTSSRWRGYGRRASCSPPRTWITIRATTGCATARPLSALPHDARSPAPSGAAADHLSAPPRLGGFVSGAVRGFANPVPKKLVVKI